MDSRARFIDDFLRRHYRFTELCERHGVSRKTGYKWLERFREAGKQGLADRSRAPLSCPHRTDAEVAQLLIDARKAHPTWGPRKLIAWLGRKMPGVPWPASSTVNALFHREGLVVPKVRRRRYKHPGTVPAHTEEPNDLWTIDFKGQFKTRNGVYCYPLTVLDLHSRYLLACKGYLDTKTKGAWSTLKALFREFGLPKGVRSDNGTPFASTGLHGLCRLNVWLMRLGITHQRIRPASPQENGAHERMHLTLKRGACVPARTNLSAQQRAFNSFVHEYNEERPHEALDNDTPASRYRSSPRPYPERLTPIEYPGHFLVKRVTSAGTIRFRRKLVYVSVALEDELIAFEESADGLWMVYFGDFLLATMDERDCKLQP